MKLKKWIPVICIVSVALMIVTNVIVGPAAYRYSWLFVFAAGCLTAILSILDKDSDNDRKD